METASGALSRSLNLARPDDVYNAIVDAHKDLSDEQCRAFDARLILLLVNHIGDDAAGTPIAYRCTAARRALF